MKFQGQKGVITVRVSSTNESFSPSELVNELKNSAVPCAFLPREVIFFLLEREPRWR